MSGVPGDVGAEGKPVCLIFLHYKRNNNSQCIYESWLSHRVCLDYMDQLDCLDPEDCL